MGMLMRRHYAEEEAVNPASSKPVEEAKKVDEGKAIELEKVSAEPVKKSPSKKKTK